MNDPPTPNQHYCASFIVVYRSVEQQVRFAFSWNIHLESIISVAFSFYVLVNST